MHNHRTERNLLKQTAKLEKELATRNRQLEIEKALEKVRRRTMAMQRSEELQETTLVLFQQFKSLKVTASQVSICVFDEDTKMGEMFVTLNGEKIDRSFPMELDKEVFVMKKAKKAFLERHKRFSFTIKGKELQNYNHWRNEFIGKKGWDESIAVRKQSWHVNGVFFSRGLMGFSSDTPAPPEALSLLDRFASLFDLTFTRFLDLQKAEAQTREAKVEAALERVRTRSMAMHQSNELHKVIREVTEQLSQLGFDFDALNITTDLTSAGFYLWNASPATPIPSGVYIPYKDIDVINSIYSDWGTHEGIRTGTFNKAQKNAFFRHYFTHTEGKKIAEERKKYILEAKAFNFSTACRKEFALDIINYRDIVYTDEQNKILEKFAKVFEQSYTRLVDLQKAEAQAREVQIELGLERVRARAMVMQNSNELGELVAILFDELVKLDLVLARCIIWIFDSETLSAKVWMANSEDKRAADSYYIKRLDHPYYEAIIKAWKEKKTKWVYELTGKNKRSIDKLLLNETELSRLPGAVKSGIRSSSNTIVSASFNNFGFIEASGPLAHTEEQLEILDRFGKVFDLSYTRFNDLQKAEAQAREAQIEAGLERVRSRAMAMQTSEELNALIGTMFSELTKLDLVLTRSVIIIYDAETKGARWWMANSEVPSTPMNFFVAYTDLPFFNVYLKGWEERDLKWQYILEGENKIATDDFLFKETELSLLPDFVIAGMKAPGKVYLNASFNNFGNLTLASLEPLSDEHFDILLRFAKVFDLTYTRFNDLKQAEAQARESQIQLALERVRARTMAMQRSDELPAAANLLFQQIQSLGMPAWSAGYCIWDEDKNGVTAWMSSEGVLQPPFHAPLTEDPLFIHMKEAHERGETFFVDPMGGEDLVSHYKYMRALPVVGKILDSIIEAGHPLPTFQIMHMAYFSHGFLLFITYQPVPEAHDIFKRFGIVFDQTYTRFLDLQKAEAQARESQIQLALERVRARTMAMQHSNELGEAASLLFKQISDLGIQTWTSGFNIWQDDGHSFVGYNPTPSGDIAAPYIIPSKEDNFFKKIYQAKEAGEDFIVFEWKDRPLAKTYSYMKTLPVVQEVLRDIEDSGFQLPTFQINHCVFFAQGFLLFITLEPYPEAHDIFKRFGKVFEQTYTRFLDLQKVEAQARESQIQLALERVRARTMAMHQSLELAETAQVLFHQLRELGGIPDRISIGVLEESAGLINFWSTDQSGTHIDQSFKARLNERTVMEKTYQAWKDHKKSLVIDLHGDDVKEWIKFAREEMGVVVKDEFIKDRRVHHFAFFSHGWILVTTHEPQSSETIQILVRFASVFNLTYRRFLDLEKAEAQAREAQIEAALERVRARTMAMHASAELIQTAELLFDQLHQLGAQLQGVAFAICDKESTMVQKWTSIGVFSVPCTIEPGEQRMYEAWKNQEEIYEEVYEGERIRKYYEMFMEIPAFKEGIQKFIDSGHPIPTWQKNHAVPFKYGYLLFITIKEFGETQIFIRFARVFEQTYTRFLDLQKAEAQVREAQIEAALEKVRSRSLAMHKSNELSAIAKTMFDQLRSLGLELEDGLIIMLFRENSHDQLQWPVFEGVETNTMFLVPAFDHPIMNEVYKARESGARFIERHFDKTIKDDFLKKIFSNTDYRVVPAELQNRNFAGPYYHYSFAMERFTGILMHSYTRNSYPAEYNDILKRFARVFEQAYVRFLDLQKAEAQAREAQIEAALERVRAHSMAMHQSSDLHDVIKVITEQLSGLGLKFNAAIFAKILSEGGWDLWLSTPEQSYPSLINVPYINHRIFNNLKEVISQGTDFFTDVYSKEEKDSFFRHFFENTIANNIPEERKKFVFSTPGLARSVFLTKNIWLTVVNYEGIPFSDEENGIFKRFANAFEQSYTRFLDLQKAEANAREAQIEASLERVRSKTMAMHNSNDVGGTVATMFAEFVHLGIHTNRCGILIFNDQQTAEVWTARSTPEGNARLIIGKLDLDAHKLLRSVHNAWNTKETFYQYDLLGDDIVQYYSAINDSKFYPTQFDLNALPSKEYHSDFFFADGAVFSFTNGPLAEEDSKIMKRFAGVFGQTYRRYLDLQKAEAQAREAQIETALERVRSRTMAMHQTSELQEVIHALHNELLNLKLSIYGGSFVVINSNVGPDLNCWGSGGTASTAEEVRVPHFNMPFCTNLVNAIKSGPGFFTEEFSQKEKKEFFTKLFETKPWADLSNEQKEATLSSSGGYTRSVAVSKHTTVFIINHHGRRFTEDENDILKRFAKVFEQTYTRFLDLQKAEAQAKEARIEAGLERVRARTMAMHSSDDVSVATATMFSELEKLGIENFRGGITNMHPNRTQDVWSVNSLAEGQVVKAVGAFNMDDHPFWQLIYKAWQKKNDFTHYFLAGQEKDDYVKILNSTQGYLTRAIDNFPDVHFQVYFFNEGGIWTNSLRAHSDEEQQIMKRFTSVFSLTFRRYQDLKRAEAQAREATIEAALEKVRGKAMAMHNSNDLSATASMVFTELRKLGINPIRCGVGLLNKESRKAQLYSATSSVDGDSLSLVGWVILSEHPVLEKIYDTWLNNEEYYPELQGEQMRSYYEQLLKGLPVTAPNIEADKKQYGHFIPFSVGCLYAWSETSYSDAELKILRRFATIIDLTFRRYIELQQSETNAREAVKQAALDRIRADIASMRTITDLDRITPLIWNELTILGLPFIRCGVFIMDDAQELIHTFLSTPEGKAIAAFHLPYSTPGNIQKVISHWQHDKNYIDHWNESDFTQFAEILVRQNALASAEAYLKTIPHGGFYLHFLPFLQGMLYVGNTTQLRQEEIELIQHVANAFSTAYARYEDFNKLEAAKQQVEKTLTDLKQAQTQLVQSEKMASLGELTAGIAHEIQNPLNFVNNFSDVSNELLDEMKEELAKGNVGDALAIAEDVKQNLEKINHHGKRADGIVKGMLQHSRTSSGQKELTDINSLADEYLRLAYHGLRAKDKSFNAKFITEFDDGVGKIDIIPQDFGRVILNLINNAFYAVSEKKKQSDNGYEPTVTITTRSIQPPLGGRSVQIKVTDNGGGISQKNLDKIFQPFFTTKPTGQGTGLGLSLAYDIVKAHGGDIRVETKQGEGSEFIIQLPI